LGQFILGGSDGNFTNNEENYEMSYMNASFLSVWKTGLKSAYFGNHEYLSPNNEVTFSLGSSYIMLPDAIFSDMYNKITTKYGYFCSQNEEIGAYLCNCGVNSGHLPPMQFNFEWSNA